MRILDVAPDPDYVVDVAGRTFGNVILTADPETVDRIRQGYSCANCLEPFAVAWPVLCPLCGMRVREQQAEVFARQYRGAVEIRPTDWDAEIERMREVHEREQKEKRNG